MLKATTIEHLPEIPPTTHPTQRTVDCFIKSIVAALDIAIGQAVPWSRTSQYSKSRFEGNTKEAVDRKNRLRAKVYPRPKGGPQPRPPSRRLIRAHEEARRIAKAAVRRNITMEHREKVTQATDDMGKVWKLARWTKNRDTPPSVFTPSIKRPGAASVTHNLIEKAIILAESFFPAPPEADLTDIPDYNYPTSIDLSPITKQEIIKTIEAIPNNKAPGTSGIPNEVIRLTLPVLAEPLTWLFNACLETGYCPKTFRKSITVALKKTGKGDYTSPKSWRPIALLCTIGKCLESVLATRLSYAVETYGLLPETHFGGRRARSPETAMHALIERIHAAWKRNEVATALFLDVSGAFDNVSHERLIHNLRKRRVPTNIVEYIVSFVRERSTELRLPDQFIDWQTRTGIPQGSSLSPILYLFYNSDLLDSLIAAGAWASGYIDDVAFLRTAPTFEENCTAMEGDHEIALDWARKHASKFAPAKYQLIHFTRNQRNTGDPQSTIGTITLSEGGHLTPLDAAKYLGVIFDKALTWVPQLDHLEHTTLTRLRAITAIAGSRWGVSIKDLTRIYTACILPLMLHAASIWLPSDQYGSKGIYWRTWTKLRAVQKQAAKAVSGGNIMTAGEAFNAEIGILPIEIQTKLAAQNGAIRTITGPAAHVITERPAYQPGRLIIKTPLERILAGVDTQHLETRAPFIKPPWENLIQTEINDELLALITHERLLVEKTSLIYYTDGSGIDDHVGGAAVNHRTGAQRGRYIGALSEYTVYIAEVIGILLALELAEDETRDHPGLPIIIFTDNQAAIQSVANPKHKSGQFALKWILDKARQLDTSITIHWIPAHVGVPGNEAADVRAKEAARIGTTRARWNRPHFPQLLSSLKSKARKEAINEWTTLWRNHPHGRTLYRIHQDINPSLNPLAKYQGLTREQSTILFQLRTGKIALNDFLYQIDRADSPRCQCGEPRQTASHILFVCPNFNDLRRTVLWQGERETRDTATLLGEVAFCKRAAIFMAGTGLLAWCQNLPAAGAPPDSLTGGSASD